MTCKLVTTKDAKNAKVEGGLNKEDAALDYCAEDIDLMRCLATLGSPFTIHHSRARSTPSME